MNNPSSTNTIESRKTGKTVLLCFIAFFGMIIVVNSIFMSFALTSQTGVITDQAYEKGLAYNDIIAKAKNQPKINRKVRYHNNVLSITIETNNSAPIENATVEATIDRPVQIGHTFKVPLTHMGKGLYKGNVKTPLPGLWTAKIDARWNTQHYQTIHEFIVE